MRGKPTDPALKQSILDAVAMGTETYKEIATRLKVTTNVISGLVTKAKAKGFPTAEDAEADKDDKLYAMGLRLHVKGGLLLNVQGNANQIAWKIHSDGRLMVATCDISSMRKLGSDILTLVYKAEVAHKASLKEQKEA